MSGTETSRSTRRGSLVLGIFLMFLGVWFLLGSLGMLLPSLADMWPIFPSGAGAALLFAYLTGMTKDTGVVWPGTAGFLIGVLFFAITLGPLKWDDMEWLWPFFPLIAGVAFLATWAAGSFKKPGLLVPGGILLATGLVGLGFTLELIQNWFPRLVEIGWPVVLIAVGLYLVAQSIAKGRKSASS